MDKTLGYTESDALYTCMLNISIRNVATQMRIDEIREKMDNCDDYQMRDNLARQLKYLKAQLVDY
mgnify:CR=1 FL=1